jgi:predicted DNA-binding transcriptional regulator AlpA
MDPSSKLRVQQAAQYLKLSQSTLNKLRCLGGGPRFAKAGPRIVIYDRADLDAWLESRTWRSTSEYARESRHKA